MLPRLHPVRVAPNRVDFPIVAEKTEGLGEVPSGERVRAVALVHQGQPRNHRYVFQVGVKVGLKLVGQEETLVDQGPAG